MDKSTIGTGLGVVAVAIAIVSLIAWVTTSPPTGGGEAVGGQRGGLQEYVDGIKSGELNSKWVSTRLEPLANSVKVYCNTSGNDEIAFNGSVSVMSADTASSTSKASLFASSTSAIAAVMDFGTLTEGTRDLLDAITIATSTTGTTTDSATAVAAGKGSGSVTLPSGSCIWGYLQQHADCTIGNAAAGSCETATSSNRGFNPVFNVQVRTVRDTQTSL